MTMLEMKMGGGAVSSTSDTVDQSNFASSPNHFNSPSTGKEVVLVIAFFMVVIYGFKVLGRVIKRDK